MMKRSEGGLTMTRLILAIAGAALIAAIYTASAAPAKPKHITPSYGVIAIA